MIRVLHISDLHYHTSGHHGFSLPDKYSPEEDLPGDRPTMVDAITDSVKRIARIDGIIVTGDLTWGAKDDNIAVLKMSLCGYSKYLISKKSMSF